MVWDNETNTFIPKPEKQATSTPQYVPTEKTTDLDFLWGVGAAVTSIGAGLYTGSIGNFIGILIVWGIAYWVVGKIRSGV